MCAVCLMSVTDWYLLRSDPCLVSISFNKHSIVKLSVTLHLLLTDTSLGPGQVKCDQFVKRSLVGEGGGGEGGDTCLSLRHARWLAVWSAADYSHSLRFLIITMNIFWEYSPARNLSSPANIKDLNVRETLCLSNIWCVSFMIDDRYEGRHHYFTPSAAQSSYRDES